MILTNRSTTVKNPLINQVKNARKIEGKIGGIREDYNSSPTAIK